MQRVNDRANTRVVFRILLRQTRGDGFHFGPRLLQRRARLQTRDHFEEVIAARGGLLRWKGERHPDLVAPVAERRQAHAARQHADDGVAFVVQCKSATDHVRIATEAPFPQALVQKNDLRPGLIFLRYKRASDDRPDA